MNGLLFLSGWAGYPELFPRLAPALVRAGTFLQPFAPDPEEAVLARLVALARGAGPGAGRRPSLVAWSTGGHLALKHRRALFPLFSRIVLASAFPRFTDHVPPARVKAMIRGLRRDPAATLAEFYALCALATDPEVADPGTEVADPALEAADPTPAAPGPAAAAPLRPEHLPALAQGLTFLLESRTPAPDFPAAAPAGPDLVLVHGLHDRVVPHAACRAAAALLAAEGHAPRVVMGLHGHLPPETLLLAILHESPHPPVL